MASSHYPQSPKTVGEYALEYEIGRGSFATVYRGMNMITKEPVAIKSVLRSKLTKKLLDSLASEINILKGIRHDHIVALYDCRETPDHIHLVMEYCSQGDLSQYIKRGGDGPLSLPSPPDGGLNEVVVRHFLKQLASAMEFLRSKNLIHRDLKPQNLLLHPSSSDKAGSGYGLPVLKIADFGFARSLPHLAMAETLCGSPLYMAPEILRYEKYDAKADLWSVGTVLYEMCTGKPPFKASNHVELLRRIEKAQDIIVFPGEAGIHQSGSSPSRDQYPPISRDLTKLIRQLLKRNPVERISFEEFFMNPSVSNLVPRHTTRARSSTGTTATGHDRISKEPSKRSSILDTTRYSSTQSSTPSSNAGREIGPDSRHDKENRNYNNNNILYDTPVYETQSRPAQMGTPPRSRPKSMKETSPAYVPENRPPLQLPLSSPISNYHQQPVQSMTNANQISVRRMKSIDGAADVHQKSLVPLTPTTSVSGRRSTVAGIPDLLHKAQANQAEGDAPLDNDYVVIEKGAVELNVLADEVAASPNPNLSRPRSLPNGNALSPPIPSAVTHYRPSGTSPFMQHPFSAPTRTGTPPSTLFFSTTPPFAVPNAPQVNETAPHLAHRPSVGALSIASSPVGGWSGSPRKGASVLAKAISIASIRLFGTGTGSPPTKINNGLIGFGTSPTLGGGLGTDIDPDEAPVLQSLEQTVHKARVVIEFADSKLKTVTPANELDLSRSINDGSDSFENGVGMSPSSTVSGEGKPIKRLSGPLSKEDSIVAEEAFFLYLHALGLFQAGMSVARQYWEEGRQNNRPASTRLNNGVQWIRNRYNEDLVKAEEAKKVSGLDDREESGVVVEKLLYERALDLSKKAAKIEMKYGQQQQQQPSPHQTGFGESSSTPDLREAEAAYQTAIWMLHAVLDGASEDGRNEAIEDDDREILNKFIGGIEQRLASLRRRMAITSSG